MEFFCQAVECDFSCDEEKVDLYAWQGCPKCGCTSFAAMKVTAAPTDKASSMMTAAATGMIERSRLHTKLENEIVERFEHE